MKRLASFPGLLTPAFVACTASDKRWDEKAWERGYEKANCGTHLSTDQDNHIEITGYLLGLDKTHIYHLGLVLGLSESRVRGMEDSKTFLDDMVVAWLQKVDQVQKRGSPSWLRLAEALRDRTVGQNGIARNILQDKIHK